MKKSIETLALFGGRAAFKERLHVGRPNIGNREHFMRRVGELLDRKWLTNQGPFVSEFESRLAAFLGVKHCIAVCSGTIGLEIAIRACDLDGEVIVPSFSFISTAHALQWQDIVPVFCDIDPRTHTIDPAKIERLITANTTGIIGVHLWGRPCDTDAILNIADRHKCKVIFDSSHAFACSHRGRLIGNFGNAEVFSFHATKFINTFEGGAITTNDDALAAKVRLMKNFGFAGYDEVVYIGTNGKMSEISAAMGLTELESLDQFVDINRRNYAQYQKELAGVKGIGLIRFNEEERCNYQYIVAEVDESVARISRDRLLSILHAENVIARRYFYPGCHRMEPYRSCYPDAGSMLPETEKLVQRVLVLPTGTAVSPAQITDLCEIIRFSIEHADAIVTKIGGKEAFPKP